MIYTQQCDNLVNEIDVLMGNLKISEEHSNEIINIYFEFFNDISYLDFITKEVRVLKKKNNENIIKQLEEYDDACAFEGDDYILITNYQTIKNKIKNINDSILINKWFNYSKDQAYAPFQNFNKIINFFGDIDDDTLTEEITSILREYLEDLIKFPTEKKQFLKHIKKDKEFLKYIGDDTNE